MAKCKHENADHLMPGDAYLPYATPRTKAPCLKRSIVAVPCECLRCLDCGAWLSLGESNDTGEHAASVAVEIRAAELAQLTVDDPALLRHMWRTDAHSEWFGWCQHVAASSNDLASELATTVHAHEEPGYLARCIATHEEP